MLYDHVDLRVSNLAKARVLYDALLPAMGFTHLSEDHESICYYRRGQERSSAFFGIVADPSHHPDGSRIALRGASREEVDRLATIAETAGAKAFEPPTVCEDYSPFYYATFFEDEDGNKLEICFRDLG
ncbi:MAG TPA: VOC family protein [Candidatus Cybelea sp.]|jgi:catechol 2,3-dioxygenase-like lactoylglutathione lyase family enzyme